MARRIADLAAGPELDALLHAAFGRDTTPLPYSTDPETARVAILDYRAWNLNPAREIALPTDPANVARQLLKMLTNSEEVA